ncbi:MAG: hypothetical protein NT047_00700 [Deltaproteobacteria bacterium]|nr:hypothetical protein [Deltaproteobacteria bacterium]
MTVRRWKFAVTTSDAGSGYLLESGDLVHDPEIVEEWTGTDEEASCEVMRRAIDFEERTGAIVTGIDMESRGKV